MPSLHKFERWESKFPHSWAYNVFNKHYDEMQKMYITFKNAHKYTYTTLGGSKASWSDYPSKHFKFKNPKEFWNFKDLKEWSNSFNDLENWMNLNTLVAISSNLEIYLSSIIPLAIESDVGILYGTPHRIDGIEIVKYGNRDKFDFTDKVISCTKGNWQSRTNSYKSIFGTLPSVLEKNISELDKIRNIRNDVAHAFGRDIEESRRRMEVTTLPILKLSDKRLNEIFILTKEIAKVVDEHLLNAHIGEYQMLLYYHELYPSLNKKCHSSERARTFRKIYGGHLNFPAGRKFTRGLVEYYENI